MNNSCCNQFDSLLFILQKEDIPLDRFPPTNKTRRKRDGCVVNVRERG